MLTRPIAALLAALALAVPAARSQPVDIPIPDIAYTKFVLRNGLTVLVHEDHKLPVVAVNTWYHVGSKNETLGKTGFAHLFEHLMFSGSENFDKTYISALSGIGATGLNGTTSNDRTNYFQNVPTSMLDYALFAESDRMGHLLGVLDQKKLDLQRGVVQNEKRQGQNQPYGVLGELLPPNLYPPGHPYSWPVIGSMKDLDAASMADVQQWFRTYYGPNNVVLVLAGDITPEVARQKAEKYYGDIPPGPPLAKDQAWVAKRSGTHRLVAQDRVPQARLYRIWNVPGDNTPEAAMLDLGAQVLGGGKTSRLYQRLVYRDQLATSATSTNDSNEIAGNFDLTLTARPGGDLRQVEKAADEEVRGLLRTGPTLEELQLAKTVILAHYARITERVGGFGGKSDLLASCMTYTGDPGCYKVYLQRIKAATPETVRKAMNDWLADGDLVLDIVPYAAGPASAASLDRSKGAPLGQPEALKLPPMREAVLSNGLKVVLAESHAAPVVNLSLLVDSGYAADPADLPGLTGVTLRMMDEGTTSRSAMRLAAELEGLGASVNTSANLDGVFVTMNTLKATLPRAIDVYADMVLHPAFAAADLERIRKEQLAGIQREKTNPQTMAMRVLPALLYGKDHGYAHPSSGTEAAVGRITRDDLVRYHREWFRPNNATLLVVGDTTLAAITPLLEKAFAGWSGAGSAPAKRLGQAGGPDRTTVYLMDRPGAQQSVIYGAQLVQPLTPQERVQLQVVNGIFGGTFSSRINMNLREDKHWSYGVFSQIVPAVGQRNFFTRSPVQTDKTREALQELVREYGDMAGAKPISAPELREAQEREALGLPGSFETASQLSNAYANVLQYRLPPDFYDTYTPTVMALTPEQANALARRSIAPGRLVWVVVGDMSKVEAGIRDLKLGEVHKIDADGNPVQ